MTNLIFVYENSLLAVKTISDTADENNILFNDSVSDYFNTIPSKSHAKWLFLSNLVEIHMKYSFQLNSVFQKQI